MHSLKKLLNKLVDFAFERNQNLPLSSTPSSASGSASSSRGASPLCENSGAKSPLRPLIELMLHGPRKSLTPRKLTKNNLTSDSSINMTEKFTRNESAEPSKEITIASDASDSSPQLMIVVDEFQQTPKIDPNAGIEDLSKPMEKEIDEKEDIEEKTVSSVKENIDEQSNLGSEINFGDFVNLLRETERPSELSSKEKTAKPKSSKLNTKIARKSRKTKKKIPLKKNEIKPVSEISAAEDEWIPVNSSVVKVSNNRPRTRSRKGLTEPTNDEIEKCPESCSSNNNTEIELILTGLNIKGIFTNNANPTAEHTEELDSKSSPPESNVANAIVGSSDSGKVEDDDDESTKSCFVKLERMKVKQRKERENTKNKHHNASSSKVEDISVLSKRKLTESLSVSLSDNNKSDLFSYNSSSESKTRNAHNVQSTDGSQSKSYLKSKSQPNSSSSSDQNDYPTITSSANTATELSAKNCSDDKDGGDKQDSKNSNISTAAGNRSKRKKGVPKRIPFDFSYPQINPLKQPTPAERSTFEDQIVDLSACKGGTNPPPAVPPDQPPLFNPSTKIDITEPNVSVNVNAVVHPTAVVGGASSIPKKSDAGISATDSSVTAAAAAVSSSVASVTESRHIIAANDFSSIENISSN